MLKIEAEKKKNVPLNEREKEELRKKKTVLSRAQELLNEEKDEVKEMNQMVMRARVVQIRDKQLNEKKRVYEDYKEEEKKKDLMMEIERLKGIKAEQEEFWVKKEKERQGIAFESDF